MNLALLCLAMVLLASPVLGLVRVVLGPTPGDRMLGVQLVGTTAVGALVVLDQALTLPSLLNVALVFALLSAAAPVAFARPWGEPPVGDEQ